MAARKPVFKRYDQQQMMLLPLSLEELIPKNHTVRVVNDVIEKINIKPLQSAYHSTGTSSYHPQMLLKVLIFGYVSNIYSTRKLEAACKENIYFMWLSAMNKPDHNTIARFRSVRLKHTLRDVFEQVVLLLAQEGLLSIEEVYTDGTKIEANANRYTFVWKRAILTNKEKMKKQLQQIWDYAQSVSDPDDLPDPPDLTTINKENVQQTVDKLNETLAGKENVDKKMKAKLLYASKYFPVNISRYEAQEAILKNRNSYSKTDPDATFMRLKEDHMRNGQLKPAYNVQISSCNQFIVNYTIHANPTDTTTLAGHIDQHEKSFGSAPKILVADAGYGSEQNYKLLEDKGVDAYVKYGLFDKKQHSKYVKKHPFKSEHLSYDLSGDYYLCPIGQKMWFIYSKVKMTENGFAQTLRMYQAENCTGCPLRTDCHQSGYDRIIQVNPNLERYKQRVDQLLTSEEGIRRRKKRCFDVEPVFGSIKNNHGFRRFLMRGAEKVAIEWGLIAIAQNIRKKAA